jgi:hypothetical protein
MTARENVLALALKTFTSGKVGGGDGGGKGSRTPDLLIANETLYQLSYTPTERQSIAPGLGDYSARPCLIMFWSPSR